jgi:hypothetical protein
MTLAEKENVTMGFTNAEFNGCNGKRNAHGARV